MAETIRPGDFTSLLDRVVGQKTTTRTNVDNLINPNIEEDEEELYINPAQGYKVENGRPSIQGFSGDAAQTVGGLYGEWYGQEHMNTGLGYEDKPSPFSSVEPIPPIEVAASQDIPPEEREHREQLEQDYYPELVSPDAEEVSLAQIATSPGIKGTPPPGAFKSQFPGAQVTPPLITASSVPSYLSPPQAPIQGPQPGPRPVPQGGPGADIKTGYGFQAKHSPFATDAEKLEIQEKQDVWDNRKENLRAEKLKLRAEKKALKAEKRTARKEEWEAGAPERKEKWKKFGKGLGSAVKGLAGAAVMRQAIRKKDPYLMRSLGLFRGGGEKGINPETTTFNPDTWQEWTDEEREIAQAKYDKIREEGGGTFGERFGSSLSDMLRYRMFEKGYRIPSKYREEAE